jgi:hypothetical protein
VHDTLAVVGEKATGEQIAQELMDAGVPEDDFDLLDPEWFLQGQQQIRDRQNIVQRIASGLAMEEGTYLHEYQDEAAEGHFLIAVHAADPERTARVRDILKAHGARRLRHYKHRTIEDL